MTKLIGFSDQMRTWRKIAACLSGQFNAIKNHLSFSDLLNNDIVIGLILRQKRNRRKKYAPIPFSYSRVPMRHFDLTAYETHIQNASEAYYIIFGVVLNILIYSNEYLVSNIAHALHRAPSISFGVVE